MAGINTKIFKEIHRVLKHEGHFCVSDVVLKGRFAKEFTDHASMYAGCLASAIQKEDYLAEIEKADFINIEIKRTQTVVIPDEVLEEHLDKSTIYFYAFPPSLQNTGWGGEIQFLLSYDHIAFFTAASSPRIGLWPR